MSDLVPFVGPVEQMVDAEGNPVGNMTAVRLDTHLVASWLGASQRLLRIRSLPATERVEPAEQPDIVMGPTVSIRRLS